MYWLLRCICVFILLTVLFYWVFWVLTLLLLLLLSQIVWYNITLRCICAWCITLHLLRFTKWLFFSPFCHVHGRDIWYDSLCDEYIVWYWMLCIESFTFFLEVDSIIISLRCTWYRGRALRGHCRDMAGWRLSRQGESERGSLLSGSKAPLPLVGVVVSRHCVVARVSCQPPRKRRVKFCGKP